MFWLFSQLLLSSIVLNQEKDQVLIILNESNFIDRIKYYNFKEGTILYRFKNEMTEYILINTKNKF